MDNNPELQFIEFCKNGNLSEAQKTYLNNPYIDISAKNEYAFRWACENGHLKVCQWLQSLKPYLYVIHYYKNGGYESYSIRSKEEAKWQQRKYLVWLASNESPNKESILYKVPQDVSRYIINML